MSKSATATAPAQQVTEVITQAPVRTKTIKLKGVVAETALGLKAKRAALKELERQVKADTEVLKAAFAGEPEALIGSVKVGKDWVPVLKAGDGTWKGTDEATLAAAFPEAFQATRVEKPYVTVSPL